MRTLTRDGAQARAALICVESYDVHLDLRDDDGFDSDCGPTPSDRRRTVASLAVVPTSPSG